MTWHLLYLWHIMHCIWHLTHDLWHHNTLWLHQFIISHIKLIISDCSSTVSLSSHPDYQSYNPHCTYDNTGTICMTSYEYIWHHIHSLWYHTTVWPSHTLSHVVTHRIPVITSTAAELLHTVFWVYHICNMCDFKPTIYMASHEFYVTSQQLIKTSQDCIHYITAPLFMTSPPLNMTSHTLYLLPHSPVTIKRHLLCFWYYSVYITSHMVNEWQCDDCIWHDTECICVIKPTWLMTSQLMYIWNHTHCMHETKGTLYNITSTFADNTPLFVCHGIHSVYEIICIIYDV